MLSLADFIKQESSAYLKEYGKGMGAYLSVRGTSSSHTSIDWNGLNLSVPTIGQTDFSHVPLYFFDAMDIHIGGSSALYGDGTLGGSIRLKTSPHWKRVCMAMFSCRQEVFLQHLLVQLSDMQKKKWSREQVSSTRMHSITTHSVTIPNQGIHGSDSKTPLTEITDCYKRSL